MAGRKDREARRQQEIAQRREDRRRERIKREQQIATGERPRRPAKKKKKPNLLPFFTVLLILFAAAGVGVLVHRFAVAQVEQEGYGTAGRETETPEYFSTIRPVQMDSQTPSLGSEVVTEEYADALIIGDSTTAKLQNYVNENETLLSSATFLTKKGYSWQAVRGEFGGGKLTLSLGGRSVSVTEALVRTGAKRLYIQLGMQDIRDGGAKKAAAFATEAIGAILNANPQVEVTVMAVTPLLRWIAYDDLSNKNIKSYNAAVKEYCEQMPNCKFLDLTELCPEGYLPREYCSDVQQLCVHWNDTGCALWVDFLVNADGKQSSKPETNAGEEEPAEGAENGGEAAEDGDGGTDPDPDDDPPPEA